MRFIEFIAGFIIVYFLVRILFRTVFPWLMRRFVERKMKEFGMNPQEHNENNDKNTDIRKGDVNIDYIPEDDDENGDDHHDAEYVDYEEIN